MSCLFPHKGTSWTRAYEFNGSHEYFKRNDYANSHPLRRNYPGDDAVTEGKPAANGRPWAVSAVFKALPSSSGHRTIWSQGGNESKCL